jgi:HK97 family phage portal protein
MGFLQRIGNSLGFGQAPAPRAEMSHATMPAAVLEVLRGGGSFDRALTSPAVYRSVSLISGAVGSMPIQIRQKVRGERKEVSDHWIVPLLKRKPNKWQTPQQFKRQLQTHLLLRGNGFAYKVGTAKGGYSQLIPMHPDRVEVKQADDWSLQYIWTAKDGSRRTLSQSEVLHLVGLSVDGVTGVSVLKAASDTIGQSIAMRRHGRAVFENSTRIGGVLTHPKLLSDDSVRRLRESMEEYKGPENAGRSLVLEEGLSYSQMAMTMEDAQFVEASGLNRSEIYQFFGLPPHMAGDTEKATSWGTGIEAMSLGFVNYTLNDWLVCWEEVIARDLLSAEPDMYVTFNRNSLVRGDIKTRWGAYAQARQWGIQTPNEIRALEDWEPMDGLDDPFAGGNGQRTTEEKPAAEDSKA